MIFKYAWQFVCFTWGFLTWELVSPAWVLCWHLKSFWKINKSFSQLCAYIKQSCTFNNFLMHLIFFIKDIAHKHQTMKSCKQYYIKIDTPQSTKLEVLSSFQTTHTLKMTFCSRSGYVLDTLKLNFEISSKAASHTLASSSEKILLRSETSNFSSSCDCEMYLKFSGIYL